MMKNFSGSPLHCNNQIPNHIRERNNRKSRLLSALPLRPSLRGYGFCMATLFFFCFGSLFYQLNGGPPKILLDIRQYLGKSFRFPPADSRQSRRSFKEKIENLDIPLTPPQKKDHSGGNEALDSQLNGATAAPPDPAHLAPYLGVICCCA